MGGRVGRREGRRGDRAGLVAVSFCGIYHHHDVSHRSSFRAVPSTEQQKQQKQQKQQSRTRRRDYNNPKGRVPYPFTLFIGRAERDTAGGRWPVAGVLALCWLSAFRLLPLVPPRDQHRFTSSFCMQILAMLMDHGTSRNVDGGTCGAERQEMHIF